MISAHTENEREVAAMAEYIACRRCDSPDCKGCNLKRLETMLENGKFDCLMNENRCINTSSDVAPVKHGKWGSNGIPDSVLSACSVCGFGCGAYSFQYCPNCGAKMDGE